MIRPHAPVICSCALVDLSCVFRTLLQALAPAPPDVKLVHIPPGARRPHNPLPLI